MIGDYQDFVTEEPRPVMLVDQNKMAIFDKHNSIMKALVGQHKTVKELHEELFLDQSTGEFSKTSKTVYRYMDELEEQGLVMVAGHRKPAKSRLTEKLYSRSAHIYFQTDKDRSDDYWESADGRNIIARYARTISTLYRQSDMDKITAIVRQYFQMQAEVVAEVLQEAGNNELLSKHMMEMGMSELKPFLSLVTAFQIISKGDTIVDGITDLFSQDM